MNWAILSCKSVTSNMKRILTQYIQQYLFVFRHDYLDELGATEGMATCYHSVIILGHGCCITLALLSSIYLIPR